MKYAIVQILETDHLAELGYSNSSFWGWQKCVYSGYDVKN